MLKRKGGRLMLYFVALLFCALPGHGQTKLLRFPDVYGDKVVFTYGGDLWLASTSGGRTQIPFWCKSR